MLLSRGSCVRGSFGIDIEKSQGVGGGFGCVRASFWFVQAAYRGYWLVVIDYEHLSVPCMDDDGKKKNVDKKVFFTLFFYRHIR